MDESKLFDEGCRLCGGDRAGFTLLQMYGRANHGANLCADHGGSDELRAAADREITRRLSLRSAPAPESATGEGEFYSAQPYPLPETLPAGCWFWAYPGRQNRCQLVTSARLVDGGYRDFVSLGEDGKEIDHYRILGTSGGEVDWTSVRKSSPPPEARDAGKTSSRSVSADAKPKAVGVSDPYRTHVNAVPDGAIAAVMAEQDLRYRKRVKELRLDMDRESPRTWRTKMGVLVGFDGPVDSKGKGR